MMDLRLPGAIRRLSRRTLRTQLALLYAGVFIAFGLALLGVTGIVLLRQSSSRSASGTASAGSTLADAQPGGHGPQADVVPIIILVIMILVAFALGWLIAGRALRPLRTIIATAKDISASNLSRRLRISGRDDELSELGETLDSLFARLEASFESQRHFVANASHELRTPLAAERTLLQVALADPDATAEYLRSTCQQLLDLGDQQERLIDALLTLASSERGVERWEPFDLAELAGQVLLDRQPEADRRGIAVDAILTTAPATGDPSLVASLVSNLVDNAIRHNRDGGIVRISTAITDGLAVLSVSNTGAFIPSGEVERLLQPFQRLGTERLRHADGYGLGLAIVRAIAGVHNATLTANSRGGGGLDIDVVFP